MRKLFVWCIGKAWTNQSATGYISITKCTLRRHQRETCALLVLCLGNLPITGGFPSKRSMTRSFVFSLICTWTNGWANNRDAGDLRRHRAYYDATVMDSWWHFQNLNSLLLTSMHRSHWSADYSTPRDIYTRSRFALFCFGWCLGSDHKLVQVTPNMNECCPHQLETQSCVLYALLLTLMVIRWAVDINIYQGDTLHEFLRSDNKLLDTCRPIPVPLVSSVIRLI